MFVALARSIGHRRELICNNTLDHGLSNARSEVTNRQGIADPARAVPTTTRPRHMKPDPRKRQ